MGDVIKKWKIIRIITLIILICLIIFAGYIIISNLLEGNYYSDILGCTTFHWYKRAFVLIMLYLYILGIPLLIDLAIFIFSVLKNKEIIKELIKKKASD